MLQGQLENDYAGFQQYTKAIASTVAKVLDHIPVFFWGILVHNFVRFLPTFRMMKLLPYLHASQQRSLVTTIGALLDLVWFHLYHLKARESTLESPSLSSVDQVPLAWMVSWDITFQKRNLPVLTSIVQLSNLRNFLDFRPSSPLLLPSTPNTLSLLVQRTL